MQPPYYTHGQPPPPSRNSVSPRHTIPSPRSRRMHLLSSYGSSSTPHVRMYAKSISIDAVLSTVAGLTYTLLSAEVSGEALSCLLLSPVIGPAAALALTAVWRAEREPEWMAEDAAVTPLLPIQDEKPLRKSAGSRARAAASPARARARS